MIVWDGSHSSSVGVFIKEGANKESCFVHVQGSNLRLTLLLQLSLSKSLPVCVGGELIPTTVCWWCVDPYQCVLVVG